MFAKGVPRKMVTELAALVFIERKENVVLLGASGMGKHRLPVH